MTERLVVDASVIAKIYLKDEDHTELATELVRRFVHGSIDLVAPQYTPQAQPAP